MAALEHWERLDILVNNAGRVTKYVSDRFLTEPTRFWEVAPNIWRMVIDTNVNGPFLMARAAVPVMLRSGWGRIVNISMNHETMRRRDADRHDPTRRQSGAAMKLCNKTALITGASKGSGRSIALGFAERGAYLFLTAREDRHGLNRTLEEAQALGVSFIDDRS